MSLNKRSLLIALVASAGCAFIAPACSNEGQVTSSGSNKSTNTGSVDMALTTGGETINSVHMVISPTGTQTQPTITRDIPVGSPHATISAFAGALLAGNYQVTMTATATSGDGCSGSAPFTITAGTNIGVTVPVVCNQNPTATSSGRGSGTINGNVTTQNSCPFLTEMVVDPLQTDVGSVINVSATANTTTGTAFAWSTTGGGTFAAPTSAATQFNCTSAGTFTVSVTLTQPGTSCTESLSTQVTCVSASGSTDAGAPSAGGATGAGGATSAGGAVSTGGATGAGGSVATNACTGSPTGSTVSEPACGNCEANNCPHDPVLQPACSDFANPADQASCQAALDCVRNTNCIAFGNVACFCGSDLDIVSCKNNPVGGATGAHGACITQIQAAFPSGSSPAAIVNSIGDVTIPGGAALNLAQCDHDFCGDPGLGGGNECIPYCK
jgi:hypothetical protein